MQENLKKQLDYLSKLPGNGKCFDCENIPAHWASINNGIFLCMDCSGEHRGFGVQSSFIKSIVLDKWNEEQVKMMKMGGNQKLKDFLIQHEMPEDVAKKSIYCSNIMEYYRKQLKTEANGQIFMEPLPDKNKFWEEAISGNNSIYSGNNNNNSNKTEDKKLFFDENNNNNNNEYAWHKNNNDNNNVNELESIFKTKPDYPKSEIIINDDQYREARNKAETVDKVNNSIPSEPKFKTFSSTSSSDPRFSSVGSSPQPESAFNSGYLGTVGNIIGTVWDVSCSAASGIKNKMNEYEVGTKILAAGGATVQALGYIGSKVIETGSAIVHSETASNIMSKTGEGLSYIKDKITGQSNGNSSNKEDNFGSTSSDEYFSKY